MGVNVRLAWPSATVKPIVGRNQVIAPPLDSVSLQHANYRRAFVSGGRWFFTALKGAIR